MFTAAFLFVILDGIFINGHGPYRFLIDTGAQSSAVTPEVARAAGLRPSYRVEQFTAAGSRLTPAAASVTIELQRAAIPGLEVLIHDAPLPRVDGTLGQNYLANFNYLLDAPRGILTLNAPEPLHGPQIPFTRHHYRMIIEARLDGHSRRFLLDSGSNTAVISGPPPVAPTAYVRTNAGSAQATLSTRILSLGPLRKRITVAELAARTLEAAADLLPAAALGVIYVNNEHSYIRLMQ